MISQEFRKHPAYVYAEDVMSGKEVAGEYVKLQCQLFLDDVNDENSIYYVDENMVNKITNLTKLINMVIGKTRRFVLKLLLDFSGFLLLIFYAYFLKKIQKNADMRNLYY